MSEFGRLQVLLIMQCASLQSHLVKERERERERERRLPADGTCFVDMQLQLMCVWPILHLSRDLDSILNPP